MPTYRPPCPNGYAHSASSGASFAQGWGAQPPGLPAAGTPLSSLCQPPSTPVQGFSSTEG